MNCHFLPNVINFCDITPLCYNPCKILCVIGINDGVFPRNTTLHNFNLILKSVRCGDNNVRDKDRYTFLLACLLPKKCIYISVIKQLVGYNHIPTDYSSILVDELLECIAQSFYLEEYQNLDVSDNIKYLRKHLFNWYHYMPFDSGNFIPNTKTQSFANEWLDSANVNIDTNSLIHSNFVTPLSKVDITTILFHDLYNFYYHPVRAWFQKRLGVYFHPNRYKNSMNTEPFVVDKKCRFQLNVKLLDYLLHNKDTDELYYKSYASGILPYGSFGKLFWDKQCCRMNDLSNQIKIYYSPEIYTLDILLKFSKIKLIGKLRAVQKIGLIRWKPSYLFMKDFFLLWLEHLIYCSVGGTGDSRLFGINIMWHYPNLNQSQAKELLFSLICGYCTGINIPLMLLYQSGGAWIHNVFDWNHRNIRSNQSCRKKARQQLIQAWQGNDEYLFSVSENRDPYLQKIIPFYLNEEYIKKIINTAELYFFNVMKYRIL